VFYYALQSTVFRYPGVIDPDCARVFGWKFRPDTWQANHVYELRSAFGSDLVIPATYAGFYHKVKIPGMSGASEPTWAIETADETLETTGLTWEAVPYNLMPLSVNVSASSWAATGCTVEQATFTDTATACRITAITATDEITLVNTVGFSNGDTDDFTVRFVLKDR